MLHFFANISSNKFIVPNSNLLLLLFLLDFFFEFELKRIKFTSYGGIKLQKNISFFKVFVFLRNAKRIGVFLICEYIVIRNLIFSYILKYNEVGISSETNIKTKNMLVFASIIYHIVLDFLK